MTEFFTLFGIEDSQVKKTCILMPLLRKGVLKGFGVKNFSRGKLYSSGNSNSFTLIQTGIGPALLGDSVLHLGQTRCQNIILFGSCGLVQETKDLNIGSLVVPCESYSIESFSEMLSYNNKDWPVYQADRGLINKFLDLSIKSRMVKCATLGSLKLEEKYITLFKEKDIEIVDMESSALFSAARYIGKKAMAIFCITDIVKERPFYINLNPAEKLKLALSVKKAIQMLCRFTERLNA